MKVLKTLRDQKMLAIAFAGMTLLSYVVSVKHVARPPLVSAHRGASRQAPENTLAAFEVAMAMKADFLEVDVRTTADGAQVCLHDRSLKRTTGKDAAVNTVTLHDIQNLSAGKWFDKKFAKEKVPTFEALCELVSRHNKTSSHYSRLYVDSKDINAREVVNTLQRYNLLDSAVFYGDEKTLQAVRGESSHARLMPGHPGVAREAEVIASLKPYAFDVDFRALNADLVSRCHAAGVRVFSDLLDENDTPQAYERALHLGIDLIQTDDVAAVKKTLALNQKEVK
ncbi:glycerophosphodiester phosphodiesterase [Chryseolinea lacunae]|uniref:Glycerophosphodiester phosphodiesterase family protein n=1 Tax=Chryseolinea lacunae TaxID=2801331 RepID=A0ABS1KK62_9BACT|nr:glycerophosphodiester phosphodiesterase family protein [Chryseolinea lacunae]MBL0739648.1 glycerophosphodiester phosphodiesterase family protein [Chryseolinea lacunae]